MSLRQTCHLDWIGASDSEYSQLLHTLDNPPADLGGYGAVVSALQACSSGVVVAARLCPVLELGGSLGSSAYPSTDDRGKIQFRSAARELVEVVIPAPLHTIFNGVGSDRIDLSNSLISALVTAVLTYGCSSSGSPLISVVNTARFRARGNEF